MEWVISAFIVNFIIGLTGIGGGSIMTPVLMLLGVNSGIAGGAALLQAGISKSFGGWLYSVKHLVDWGVVKALWLGSMPAALLCVLVKLYIPSVSTFLTLNFNILIVVMLLISLGGIWLKASKLLASIRIDRPLWSLTVGGLILGVAVSLTSIGAGILGTVLLLTLRPSLDANRLVGTELVHAVPLALLSSVGFLYGGVVDWGILGLVLLGAFPGMWLGVRFAVLQAPRAYRISMSGVLLGLAIFHAVKL